jgi:agmatinase
MPRDAPSRPAVTGLRRPARPFLGANVVTALSGLDAAFAFLGMPFGAPYDMRGVYSEASKAPDAVREMAWEQEFADELHHYDFDLGGPLMPSGERPSLVDLGDLEGDPRDLAGNRARGTELVESILRVGTMPLVVGGDDSIPPIVVAAYRELERIHVLHIDAHIDFRDEVRGVRDGYSSPIRRIREMPWVDRIVQVGMRGPGSARPQDVADALAAGNLIVTAEVLHDKGTEWLIEQLSMDAPWFVSIDVDGLDPSVAPGTGYPLPGGLTFRQAATLVRTIAGSGLLAGIDFTELYPSKDVRGLTALTVVRLLMNAIGMSARGAGNEGRVMPPLVGGREPNGQGAR